jgi:hypothetical protein
MKMSCFLVAIVVMLVGCSEDAKPTDEASIAYVETEAPSPKKSPTPGEQVVVIEPSPSFTVISEPEQPTEDAATPTRPPDPTPEPSTPTPLPSPTPPPAFYGEPLSKERGEYFSGSGTCTICHSNLSDESGNDVSMDKFWRSTMMANAARDPYWQASVRAEILELPGYQAIIEDTCAKCHLPMGRTTLAADGEQARIFDGGMLAEDHLLHELGMEGVSCTLCHQVEADNLGDPESFSGGYMVDMDLPAGERVIYGPFPVRSGHARVMQNSAGFIPVQSEHVQRSELCAACHTLYTPTIDEAGEVAGLFPEQMPFLEWQHSDYIETQSCQDCHMPAADGAVSISSMSRQPYSPVRQHAFVGGNAYMLRVLRTYGEEMGVTASSELIEDTMFRVVNQLQEKTANVELVEGIAGDGRLELEISISNNAGHKFPSGYPSRRAWLHVTVTDANGSIVFESGVWNKDGSIVGNDSDAESTTFEPHYETISDPNQVQIYETQLIDTEGRVTTTLLRGSRYTKDNRLLPNGFDKESASEDIAVRGLALEDPNFNGDGDLVRYEIDTGEAQGPFLVSVELLYQTIGFRWAENLREESQESNTPEIDAFVEYYETITNEPVVISTIEIEIGS